MGDLIYAMPGIKQVCEVYKGHGVIYIHLDQQWNTTDGKVRVGMTKRDYDNIRPLLMAQPYIYDVQPWVDQKFAVDLDLPYKVDVNIPYGYIPRWFSHCFPDMASDLGEKWLETHKSDMYRNTVVINRTSRYTNPIINYKFLKPYQNDIVFVGHIDEYLKFCKENDLDVLRFEAADLFDVAFIINSCKFFIGNQSLCFAIAEGLKVPRVLEASATLPNVIPHGKNGFDFLHQKNLEYYFFKLMGKEEVGYRGDTQSQNE
jgi:hypothetical protein